MPGTTSCQGGLEAAGGVPLCQGSYIGSGNVLYQVATIGQTKTFSPSLVWDGLIGYQRMGVIVTGIDYGQKTPLTTLGIPGANGGGTNIIDSGAPQFVIDAGASYSQVGGDTDTRPNFYWQDTFTLSQNIGWTKSKHDMRFGFEAVRHKMNFFEPDGGGGGGPRGQFDFTGGITALKGGPSTTQYNAYGAFLLGLPQEDRETLQYENFTAYEYDFAWYARDRWQVTPRLTVSIGLRYELYPMMTRAGIEEYNPNTNLIALGGNGNNPKDLGISTSHKLFSPRLGLAYRLGNSTVIRTGYGITTDPMPLARPLRGFYPLTVSNLFLSPNTYVPFQPIEQGIPAIPTPNLSAPSLAVPPTAQVRFITGDYLKRGYTQSWNFIIERELPGNFLVTAGYVGTQSVHLFADLDMNAGVPGGGAAGQPLDPLFGRTAITMAWIGWLSSHYNALQMSVNRRFAGGLTWCAAGGAANPGCWRLSACYCARAQCIEPETLIPAPGVF